jgi:hypothetical protein
MPSKIKHDKIEDNPKYHDQLKSAEKEAEEKCAAIKGHMGYCHAFWGEKKRILLEKYGLKWKSPAELNKHVKFD